MTLNQRLLAACEALSIDPWVPGMALHHPGRAGRFTFTWRNPGAWLVTVDQEHQPAPLNPAFCRHDLSQDPTLDLLVGMLRRAVGGMEYHPTDPVRTGVVEACVQRAILIPIPEYIVVAFEALAEHKRRVEA